MPIDESRLLAAVGAIYRVTTDEASWPGALKILTETLGGTAAFAHTPISNANAESPFFEAYNIAQEGLEQYAEFYWETDIWTDEVLRRGLPDGTVNTDQLLAPDAILEGSEFYNDFLRFQEVRRLLTLTVGNGSGSAADKLVLSMYRNERGVPFDTPEVDALKALTPHLRRAWQIVTSLRDAEVRLEAADAAFDALPHGVLALGRDHRILYASRTALAMIGAGDALQLSRDRLLARRPADDEALQQALKRAIAADGRPPLADIFSIEKRWGGPIEVLVVPVGEDRGPAISVAERVAAVVVLRDADRHAPIPAAMLAKLHGLTPAEAEMLADLFEGRSVKEYAEMRGITENTARWRSKQLLSKTGTRTQGELIRLVADSLVRIAAENEAERNRR